MTTLTDRYVAAVLRVIPEAHRTDIQAELQAAIGDAIDERVASGQVHDAAERAVLNGLGEPARLAAEYSHRPIWLIGPDYFFAWLRLTKWLLWTLPALVGVGTAAMRLAFGESALDALLSGLVGALVVALNVMVWSTLGFIIAERSPDAKPSELGSLGKWSVEQLPVTAVVDRRFGLTATVGSVILNVFLIVLLSSLLSPAEMPIVNASTWTSSISVMIVLLAISAVTKVIRYARGRWTPPLAIVNAILYAAFAAWWVWALWDLSILDPQLVTRLYTLPSVLIGTRIAVLVIVAACVLYAAAGFAGTRRQVNDGRRLVMPYLNGR